MGFRVCWMWLKRIFRFIVNSKKLEHPSPHTPKGTLKGIPALIILKPCSNFLEFALVGGVRGFWAFGAFCGVWGV